MVQSCGPCTGRARHAAGSAAPGSKRTVMDSYSGRGPVHMEGSIFKCLKFQDGTKAKQFDVYFQMGCFSRSPSPLPFCGRKGRVQAAVKL